MHVTFGGKKVVAKVVYMLISARDNKVDIDNKKQGPECGKEFLQLTGVVTTCL